MFPRHFFASRQRSTDNRGFTLIEVLITVAIIGILSAIAYPQYGKFVTKSRRADGQMALLQEIQSLERCKATNYSYAACNLSSGALTGTSEEGNYNMSLVRAATTFTITATGTGPQASDDDCKVMTINQQNVRTPDESKGCWPN